MYEAHWGLKEKPFENTPDPRFIFFSPEHLEAATRLTYAVEEIKGAALLTGEYGCGKTVISRLLFDILPEEKYDIALVTNPMLDPTALLVEICFQLSINCDAEASKPHILRDLNDRLYKNVNKGKSTIIMVDEAQSIKNISAFEELRLLLNFQLNERFLLTLILIGQPELREKINELKQLKQRLTIRYHLNPLNKENVEKYIVHRLKKAGTSKKIFSEGALNIIWEHSEGIPRMINTVCDMCLLTGFTKRLKYIDEEVTRKSILYLDQ